MDKEKNYRQINCTSRDVVLIITACIQPNMNQRYLVLKDVSERLFQYLSCIEYYIAESPFCNIVFCDNSNYSIIERDALVHKAKLKGKNLEMLSFMGNSDLVAKYSTKGIGEDEIMDYVLTNSVLASQAKTFFKVTGRLLITNLQDLVKDIHYGCNYFLRDMYSDTRSLDTRFYAMDMVCYNQLLHRCYERVNDYDMSYERAFFLLIRGNYLPFRRYPRFVGRSSGVGIDYGSEPKIKLKVLDTMCGYGIFNNSIIFIPILYTNRLLRKIKSLFRRIRC